MKTYDNTSPVIPAFIFGTLIVGEITTLFEGAGVFPISLDQLLACSVSPMGNGGDGEAKLTGSNGQYILETVTYGSFRQVLEWTDAQDHVTITSFNDQDRLSTRTVNRKGVVVESEIVKHYGLNVDMSRGTVVKPEVLTSRNTSEGTDIETQTMLYNHEDHLIQTTSKDPEGRTTNVVDYVRTALFNGDYIVTTKNSFLPTVPQTQHFNSKDKLLFDSALSLVMEWETLPDGTMRLTGRHQPGYSENYSYNFFDDDSEFTVEIEIVRRNLNQGGIEESTTDYIRL